MKLNAPLAILLTATIGLSGCNSLVDGIDGLLDQPDPLDFVSNNDYDRWVIEVDVMPGAAPPAGAIDLAKQRMEASVTKPGGINFAIDDQIPGGDGSYSLNEIQAIARQYRDKDHGPDNTAATYILYLDGNYADNDNVLGVAFGGDTIALFSKRIESSGNLFVSSATVHKAVLIHELGHILGLVNNGLPMQQNHEDPDNEGHSDNRNSVMYWAVETGNIVTLVQNGGTIPLDFDANDKRDLCNAGGKC